MTVDIISKIISVANTLILIFKFKPIPFLWNCSYLDLVMENSTTQQTYLPLQLTSPYQAGLQDQLSLSQQCFHSEKLKEHQEDIQGMLALNIDQLDELVDLRIGQYLERIVQNSLRINIRKEIQEICLYGGMNQQSLENSKTSIISLSLNTEQNTPQLSFFSQLNILVHQLFNHIQGLTQSGQSLTKTVAIQQKLIEELKEKCLSEIKQFTEYKKEATKKYLDLSCELEQKQKQITNFKQKLKEFQEELSIKNQQIRIRQQEHKLQIESITHNYHLNMKIDMLEFITQLNSQIFEYRSLISILPSNNYNQYNSFCSFSDNIEKVKTFGNESQKSKEKSNLYQLKILDQQQSISKELQFYIQKIRQSYEKSFDFLNVISQLKQLITNHQFEFKDCENSKLFNSSTLNSNSQQLKQQDIFGNQIQQHGAIIQNITVFINQFATNLIKHKRQSNQIITKRQKQIRKLTKQLDFLKKFILSCKENENSDHIIHSAVKQNLSLIKSNYNNQSPIDLLNRNIQNFQTQSLKIHKSQIQQVSQFDQNESEVPDNLHEQQIENPNEEKLTCQFNNPNKCPIKTNSLIDQILQLKLQIDSIVSQNIKLKDEIAKINESTKQKCIKLQIESKLSSVTVEPQLKQRSQSIKPLKQCGKIKRVSAIQHQNLSFNRADKQNNSKDLNLSEFTNKTQKVSEQKTQQKIKQLQKKVSQYKESIINLNQIVNYIINSLRGYEFARFSQNSQNRASTSANLNSQSLPVRPYTYLDNQLKQAQLNRNQIKQSFSKTDQKSCHKSINKLVSKQVLRQKYQNFQFVRKLCLKQRTCKQVLSKFHLYLDYYLEKAYKLEHTQIAFETLQQQQKSGYKDNYDFPLNRSAISNFPIKQKINHTDSISTVR